MTVTIDSSQRVERFRGEALRPVRRVEGSARGTRPTNGRSLPPLRVVSGGGAAVACGQPRARLRKGRIALALVGLCSAVAVVVLAVLNAVSAPDVPQRTEVVQVHEGQTLSGIAEASAPEVDDSAMLDRIQELNGLSSMSVRVGQSLVVPVSDGATATS